MIKIMSHNEKCAIRYGNSTPTYENNSRDIENVLYIMNNRHCSMRNVHNIINKPHNEILTDFWKEPMKSIPN